MLKNNLALGAALLPLALNAQVREKPNVILIMTDQQTAGAMSCAGNPYLRTPAMDALASDGILFTGAYSPFPLSGPCRASLLTGCYPSVVGAVRNGSAYRQEYVDNGIGHRMSDAGYECMYAGKFHAPEQSVPENSGFKKICNFLNDPEIVPNVDKALDGYDGSKPLFLVVNFNNPHEICQAKHEEPLKMTGYIPEADPCRYPPLPQNFKRTDKDPDLFSRKVEEIVFVSVPTHGENATNVDRDTTAVRIIFESGVPILAVPAVRQKLTGNHRSLPVFIPETQWRQYGIKAVRCSASYSPEASTCFPEDTRGNDFIMTEWDEKALLEFAMKTITGN